MLYNVLIKKVKLDTIIYVYFVGEEKKVKEEYWIDGNISRIETYPLGCLVRLKIK